MIDVSIKKRVKTYNGLNHIEVKNGFKLNSVTQILGPSGAGKTTLLKIIAGLITPEQGTITVNGKIWLNTQAKINIPPQKRNVGFVFQDYALFPNMTVEEHLRYGTKDESYIDRLMGIGQLDAFRRHKPKHLSGGQQQRLAILRALSTRPKLLLMDEPFAALDKTLKDSLIGHLKTLIAEQGITCLLVTHHPYETNGFADDSFELA